MTTRRSYSAEFKAEAVRLAEQNGVAQTSRDLGIHRSLLGSWKNKIAKATENGRRPFPGKGNPQDEELAKLRRHLRRAQEENEILKKAVGIFSIRPR